MKRHIFMILLFITLFNVGCSSSEDKNQLHVMIFSDLLLTIDEVLLSYFNRVANEDDMNVDLSMFLPLNEKLVVELVAGEGHIYIVEEFMFPIIFDPVILHPLNEIASLVEEDGQHSDRNEATGEEQVYALTVKPDARIFQYLGIETKTSYIAVMLRDTPNKELGYRLIQSIFSE